MEFDNPLCIFVRDGKVVDYPYQEREIKGKSIREYRFQVKLKDCFVLMSDGVYDLISLREIEHILAKTGSCQQKALAVIEKVNRDTSTDKDNASVVLVGTALSG